MLCTDELSLKNAGKLRLYLSKADTAGVEKDRQVGLVSYNAVQQISIQKLHIINNAAYEM